MVTDSLIDFLDGEWEFKLHESSKVTNCKSTLFLIVEKFFKRNMCYVNLSSGVSYSRGWQQDSRKRTSLPYDLPHKKNHLPCPAGHGALDAAQSTDGFLGWKCTVPVHAQFIVHQYPQALLHWAAINPFIPLSVLILRIALTRGQDLALGLADPHEIPLHSCQGPSGWYPFPPVNSLHFSLDVMYRLDEGALNPTVSVVRC